MKLHHLALIVLLCSPVAAQWVDIGLSPQWNNVSWGGPLNDMGAVIGHSGPPYPTVVWIPDTPNGLTGTTILAPPSFYGRSLNNSGLVCGSDSGVAAVWDPTTNQVIHYPSGGNAAFDISDTGRIMTVNGMIDTASSSVVVPHSGSMNEYGQVAYFESGVGGWLWTPDSPGGSTGTTVSLGYKLPTRINNYGQMVSADYWLWTPTVPNGSFGSWSQVDHPNEGRQSQSVEIDINDEGQIAYSWTIGYEQVVMLWTPFVPNGTVGFYFSLGEPSNNFPSQVAAINNAGQVAIFNGPYLWFPTPGGAAADDLQGSSGSDYIDAGQGDDIVDGRLGDDLLYGGDGNDALIGGGGEDILFGDDGSDSLTGGADVDQLYGGPGADVLDGGSGDDTLVGGDGNDIMDGGQGSDILIGGAGDDCMDCTSGDSQGSDYIDGGPGDDVIFGGQGDDELYGGSGDDQIEGRSGNDHIEPGAGLDSTDAGAGVDTLVLSAGDVPAGDVELLDGGTGADTLVLNGFQASDITGSGTTWTVTDPVTGGQYSVIEVETIVIN